MLIINLKKLLIRIIKLINYVGSGLSIRLVKFTGKSKQRIHPKHLIDDNPEYLQYFQPDDIVLDIGCSNGQRDFKIAPIVKKIIAFDYCEKSLKQAKEWQKNNNIENIYFQKLSAEDNIPYADKSFDKILFLDVLEHLNNRNLILNECNRLLKQNGKMIIAVPNSETSWKKFQKSAGMPYYSDPDHKIEFTEKEISSLLKETNFNIEKVSPIVFDFFLNGIIDLIGGINLKLYKKLMDWKIDSARKNEKESIGFMIIATKQC